jgi:hypothetical protein
MNVELRKSGIEPKGISVPAFLSSNLKFTYWIKTTYDLGVSSSQDCHSERSEESIKSQPKPTAKSYWMLRSAQHDKNRDAGLKTCPRAKMRLQVTFPQGRATRARQR